ncbi:integrase core domain-containing protein [Planktomarina sp.]|uniref:integrase core domain-containing protein n=1 Tax=Planktomarina sp. TaxID=2024851 RepID=UPI003530210F
MAITNASTVSLRPETLNTEWFHSVKQAQVAINIWLKEYNHIRPHHALGMRPPVPETLLEKREIYGTEIGADGANRSNSTARSLRCWVSLLCICSA